MRNELDSSMNKNILDEVKNGFKAKFQDNSPRYKNIKFQIIK